MVLPLRVQPHLFCKTFDYFRNMKYVYIKLFKYAYIYIYIYLFIYIYVFWSIYLSYPILSCPFSFLSFPIFPIYPIFLSILSIISNLSNHLTHRFFYRCYFSILYIMFIFYLIYHIWANYSDVTRPHLKFDLDTELSSWCASELWGCWFDVFPLSMFFSCACILFSSLEM